MAREIVKQPWRLGLIVFLLVISVTGMLLLRALGDNSLSSEPAAVAIAAGSEPAAENPTGPPAGTPIQIPSVTGLSTQLSGSTGDTFAATESFSTPAPQAVTSFISNTTSPAVSFPRAGDQWQSPPQNLPQTGSLSGIVTGAVRDCPDCPVKTTVPLAGISVYLVDTNSRPTGATAVTGADGRFLISGIAPGGYNIYFEDPSGKYDSSWYLPETIVQPDPVRVAAGRQTSIGMTLYPASETGTTGAISGHVQNGGGKAVAGVTVIAYWSDLSSGEVLVLKGMAKTDPSGDYIIAGLPANEDGPGGGAKTGYKVLFVPGAGSGYPQQWYQNQATHETAKLLTVGSGAEVSGIDAVLGESSRISGTVRGGGAPLAGVLVDIFDDSGIIVSSVMTDFSGGYSSGPLAAGVYKIRAAGSIGYAQEWYSDKTDFASADPVSVSSGGETSGIDLNLNATATTTVAAVPAAGPHTETASTQTLVQTAPVTLPEQTGDAVTPGADTASGTGTGSGNSTGTATGETDTGTAGTPTTGDGDGGTSTVPAGGSGGNTGGETLPPGGNGDEPPLQCPTEEELRDPAWRARHRGPIDPRCPSEQGADLSTEASAEQQQR